MNNPTKQYTDVAKNRLTTGTTTLFLLLILPSTAFGQIQKVKMLTNSCEQYQKLEWAILLKGVWTDPYNSSQVCLDMLVETPEGKKLTVPCFYLKGQSGAVSEWRARFTPEESGAYTATFRLSQPEKAQNFSDATAFSVSSSDKKGFLHPHDNWTLQFDNGTLFRGIGQNICWEARKTDDSKYFKNLNENPKFNYPDMLKKLKKSGGNFFRTWMVYWNLPIEWKKPMNTKRYSTSKMRFNESGMKRMDELVELCDSLDIFMMLTIDPHVSFLGDGWKNSVYNKANGGFAETPIEFFASKDSRKQYKDKLRMLVARWGYSPAIAYWEFFNEIDHVIYANTPKPIPDSIISDWNTEMGNYFKEIDPYKHMVTTSISHRDVAGLYNIDSFDLNQRHIYKNTFAIPEVIRSSVKKFNKPFVIGEFGYEWDWSKNFNDFADEMNSDYKRGLWLGLFSPTPVLPMSWWWEFFDKQNIEGYMANVKEIHENIMSTGSAKFAQVNVTVSDSTVVALGITNGKNVYAYVYNPGAKDITCDISFDTDKPVIIKEKYLCEKAAYEKMAAQNAGKVLRITLPAKQDVVFIGNN